MLFAIRFYTDSNFVVYRTKFVHSKTSIVRDKEVK